jgi:ligand-binding SRPBCC domain-containing protein
VQRSFRNSLLDDLEAGIAPDSKAGDYSDVLVTTPLGEIPWPKLSRFDDEEIKTLRIDVVQKTYEFIRELFGVENGGEILLRSAARDPVP